MARDQVQVNPDGSGKAMLSWSQSLDGVTKYAQAVVNVDDNLTPIFPEAAALSDSYANPTATAVYSLGGVWNGATWDRAASANQASNTGGTGLAGAGLLAYDGTNWQRMSGVVSDSGQNALLVAGNRKEVTFSTTTNQVVSSVDVSNYRAATVHVTNTGAGATIAFQGSNDNVNWIGLSLQYISLLMGAPTQSTSAPGVFTGPLPYRYFRLNVTGQTSGTSAGVVEFFAVPPMPSTMPVVIGPYGVLTGDGQISGGLTVPLQIFNGTSWDRVRAASVGDGVGTGILATGGMVYNGTSFDRVRTVVAAASSSGTGVLAAGVMFWDQNNSVYRGAWNAGNDAATANNLQSVGPLVYNGATWDRLRTANSARATTGTGLLGAGNLGQYNSARPTVTSGNWEALQIDSGGNLKQNDSVFTYNHITTNATTTVKSGNGWLNAIVINKPGSAWVLTIFDSTTGTGTTIGVLSPTAVGTIFYNVQFATGLTIVTTGTTAGDATVSYL